MKVLSFPFEYPYLPLKLNCKNIGVIFIKSLSVGKKEGERRLHLEWEHILMPKRSILLKKGEENKGRVVKLY